MFGWEKMRVKGRGGTACATDLYDRGIYLGVESLAIPLDGRRTVASRLGNFFDMGSNGRTTLLPGGGGKEFDLEKLIVLVGVYGKDEDIPNSAGVLDLGLY